MDHKSGQNSGEIFTLLFRHLEIWKVAASKGLKDGSIGKGWSLTDHPVALPWHS